MPVGRLHSRPPHTTESEGC